MVAALAAGLSVAGCAPEVANVAPAPIQTGFEASAGGEFFRLIPTDSSFRPGTFIRAKLTGRALKARSMLCDNQPPPERLLQGNVPGLDVKKDSGGSFQVTGQFLNRLNADLGGNAIRSVELVIENATILRYSEEALENMRGQLSPGCQRLIRQTADDDDRGEPIQVMAVLVADVTYRVQFNRDNPRVATLNLQSQVTDRIKAGLTAGLVKQSATAFGGKQVWFGMWVLRQDDDGNWLPAVPAGNE